MRRFCCERKFAILLTCSICFWLCREIVELGRKLALTSILALIAPGSAGQVVVGLLLVRG